MPCNAWNHAANCSCDFRGGHGSGGFSATPVGGGYSSQHPIHRAAESVEKGFRAGAPRSLTIPNARCPVCGDSVFFYQNEYGSRVFFDELGPPWPKHSCTDNSRYDAPTILISSQFAPSKEFTPVWMREGWRPALISYKYTNGVILKDFEKDEYFNVALHPARVRNVFPILFLKILSVRRLKVSYFHSGVRSMVTEDAEYKRALRR